MIFTVHVGALNGNQGIYFITTSYIFLLFKGIKGKK